MSREKPQAVEGLVTSDAVQAGAKLRRRLLIGSISLVVLLGLGAGVWYVWTRTSLFRTATTTKVQVHDYSALSPTDALKAAQKELQDAATPAEKAAAYSNLGQAYMRNNQPTQAVGAYEQAVDQSGTAGSGGGSGGNSGNDVNDIPTLTGLADAYAAAGDKAKAIKTLQQIIAIINASDVANKERALSRYESDIEDLGGTP